MADLAEDRPGSAGNPNTAFEPSDWALRPIAWLAAGVLLFLGAAPLAMLWLYPQTLADADRSLTIAPPGPRLQIDSARELAAFRAEEQRRLDSYYWVDKGRGVVHIPIDEAMRKLARQGIPGFPAATP